MPREFAGRYPSARHQVAASEVVADLRLELVRCIAIAETDDDLVSGEDDGPAAVGKLDAPMLAEFIDPRHHQISGARLYRAGEKRPHPLDTDTPRGEGTLRSHHAFGHEEFHDRRSTRF